MKLEPRIVGATLGALAALAVGGVGLAWAQEAPTTTAPPAETPTTQAPSGDDATPDDEDCPHGDERGGSATTGDGVSTSRIDL